VKPLVLTVAGTAEVLAISEALVRRMVKDGRLPSVEFEAKSVRIPVAAVEELVARSMDEARGQRERLDLELANAPP
jgi:excisionase family DNA binding protein